MTTDNSQDTGRTVVEKATKFKVGTFRTSQWEVVSEAPSGDAFRALQLEALTQAEAPQEDPLFERYDDLLAAHGRHSSHGAGGSASEGEGDESSEGEIERLRRHHAEELKTLEAQFSQELEQTRLSAVEQGRSEAKEECDTRLRMLEERYTAVIEDMNLQIREGIDGIERRAVDFALQVTRKLVGTAVEINPEYVLQVIQEAVKLTGGATIKAIRVSAQDMEFLKMLSPERQFKEFDGSWSFQADESIRAGCIVETSAGEVDCDLEKAWERIREHVVRIR